MLKNNFTVASTGYHHLAPYMEYRFQYASIQRLILGKDYVPGPHFLVLEGHNLVGAYFEEKELALFAEKTIQAIIRHPDLIERIHSETFEFNDQYFAYAQSLRMMDLSRLSSQKLAALYKKLIALQMEGHMRAVLTTWFVDCENKFSDYLMNLARELTAGAGLDATTVFSIITTPHDLSFQLKEEIDFLKLAKKASKNQKIKNVFRRLQSYSKLPAGLPAWFVRALNKHWDTWRWQPFGYLGPAHGIDHTIGLLAALFLKKKPIAEELLKRKRHTVTVRAQQQALRKKLSISEEHQRIFAIARDIIALKAYRKDCGFHGLFVLLEYIFPEIARRTTVPVKHMWLYTNQEIVSLLKRGVQVSAREIEKRRKLAVFVNTKRSYRILTGKKAEQFLKQKEKMIRKEPQKRVDSSKGSPAYPGTAKGDVRWVNTAADMPAMRNGDILFAHTTFPALLPAMKKAAAIVTEDGGITCHAAIVARELKIPCVTGIKNAAYLFADGERVEVNATKGTVKRLSR